MNSTAPIQTEARKQVDLARFKEALQIVRTGKDSNGGKYNSLGTMNQAAWIGENSGCLIAEIENLRSEKSSGFDLNKLKAELYESGRAEHTVLLAVAEAANEVQHCILFVRLGKLPQSALDAACEKQDSTLAALAVVRGGEK